MKDGELERDFKKAVEYVNHYTDPLPADFLLKLYAYYKIATENSSHPSSKTPLINAFKANALIQAQDMDKEKAMKEYVALVRNELEPNL
ncbi:MAG: acyl-CoA-binding protein [Flavobacteriaceae bacterium]